VPGSRSFKDYVSKRYDNYIFNSISNYLIGHREELTRDLYNIEHVDYVDLQSAEVKRVYVDNLPGSMISFTILVEACYTAQERSNRYGESEEDGTKWFSFTGSGDLGRNLEGCKLSQPEEYQSKPQQENPLDDSLVPYVRREQYEDIATKFLKAAGFDAAITAPIHLDPLKVADAFGLTVRRETLSSDGSVFGRIFFCDDKTTIYDGKTGEAKEIEVKGKTIMVDPFANYMKSLGHLDNTIIHECFHWFMHKKAFELERLYNEHASQIGCLVTGGVQGDARESTTWMERQANAITPRIQMPLTGFKQHVSNLIRKYKGQGMDYLDALEPIIREISTFYNVSLTAAKIRLIDAGYHDAAGSLNYVDGHYVRPHSWKKDSIEKNQTFTIGELDAAIQSLTYARKEIESGKYEYIESHFVFKSPKYITEDLDGNRVLTEYARRHMDECALVFDLSLRNPEAYGESYHTECYLNKDEHSPFEFDYQYTGKKPMMPEQEEKALEQYLLDAEKVAATFNSDFSFCMKASKDFMGVSYNVIADRVDIDERQVRRIFAGESGSLETIVAVLFAMELPPQLSLPLMERAPHKLMPANDNHNRIKIAFLTKWGNKIEDVRKHLLKYDIQI
jgi:hypothetical protein